MKKQFNRMRQLANQTVGRAEKTEVLSEDLLQVEKRLDLVKQVSHSTHKKLTACLQGQQGTDLDKRSVKSPSKKLPLTILAQCMVEGAAVLGDDSLLGKMLTLCGETEEKLAQELLVFEFQIERDVVEPLYVLAEVEIPNIQKQRKHLAKLVLDMDSARTRWQQSSKSSSHPSNVQQGGAKSDSLREEMEETANRMEICRDQLSADMYNFMAKEIDYANYFQTLIEVQAEYHKKSLEILQSVLPQIKAHQEAWIEKPSYGKAVEEHLAISGREIAFPIEACVTMLLECGMEEEGLFRVAPSASKLKKLKASLDCGVMDVQEYSADPHAIAGALKSYLRELPEPLMTFELYDEWIQASNVQDMDKRLQALLCTCEKLPADNLNNFRYLIKFLAKLTEHQDANKMTPGNIAIVLGPNLLWTHSEGNMTEMMTTMSLQIVGIVEPIIQHADWFFPGDIEFNLTGSYGSPVHTNHNSNYSSMPSPDMDQSERKQQHDQSRRPLSVATDNMMLEFYKKDGIRKIQSVGVRVMDTSWVKGKSSSTLTRKSSSTPPQAPGSPADTLTTEQPGELATSPIPTPPPGDRGSSDDVSPNRPDSSHVYSSHVEERPPPPYPSSSTSCHPGPHHFYPKPPPCARPVAPGPESQPPSSPPPPLRWAGFGPPLPLPQPQPPPSSSSSSSSSSLDINSNPKPICLYFPKHGPLCDAAHAAPPDANASPLYIKSPLVLTRHDMSLGNPPSLPSSAPPPWAACPCARERGPPRLTSTLKSKELSPVIGHKSAQASGATVPPVSGQQSNSQSPHSAEHSPHTLHKASKKLAPVPPKVPYGQSGGISDQSTGQPSPVSLSPTPPSTPSPYSLGCPPGHAPTSSPGQTPLGGPHTLSSPPSLTGTLTKSRPTPKPRQRPSLPPPQQPTVPPTDPQPLEQGLLDGLSPGESMSTAV
ncbi:rho GTPase-activating protein 44-like isoform X4 [Cyprinus carpio]|uniref:Rho GTPase-activating protein 44 n=1 Tax=Cyprinus carpio TaxID=7962 RepID=A0A9Q9ZVV4_CYPCA|nr:rho GTPase-activating protein 44-like isoform X4 [Cyprinus carpio]XP_042575899.1 rho GTPase-activating protein 44-like isoform X4 [Cyprinus carpio]XP_042575905.1 rho GTPase-activating protein 44-like isoform X4 [Cyprinus carpio]